MKSQGAHATAASEIIKGKVPYDSDLSYHAAALNSSTQDLVKLFPAGSDFGETRAKAEIWSKRSEFEKAAKDAEKAGGAFLAVVNSGDKAAIRNAFGDLAETCKGCHKHFREKKE
jgi:cytochrome c556